MKFFGRKKEPPPEPWRPSPYLPDGAVPPGSNRAQGSGGGVKKATPHAKHVHGKTPPLKAPYGKSS